MYLNSLPSQKDRRLASKGNWEQQVDDDDDVDEETEEEEDIQKTLTAVSKSRILNNKRITNNNPRTGLGSTTGKILSKTLQKILRK